MRLINDGKSLISVPGVVVWYELEYFVKGKTDWFSSGRAFKDTQEEIKYELDCSRTLNPDMDWRAVKKTLTTEVIEG